MNATNEDRSAEGVTDCPVLRALRVLDQLSDKRRQIVANMMKAFVDHCRRVRDDEATSPILRLTTAIEGVAETDETQATENREPLLPVADR